jgi:thioredoxin 1
VTDQEQAILDHLRSAAALVVYFSTPHCTVCGVLRPKVEAEIAKRAAVDFLYIDSSAHPAVAAQHMVFAAPTLLMFIEGKEYRRFSRNFSLEDLAFALDRVGLL